MRVYSYTSCYTRVWYTCTRYTCIAILASTMVQYSSTYSSSYIYTVNYSSTLVKQQGYMLAQIVVEINIYSEKKF